jgi:hypothetical protein
MLEINSPRASVATITEVRENLRETFETAQNKVVYVVSNNQKLGAVIGARHLELLEQALEREEDARMLAIAKARLERLKQDEAGLLDEDDFWEKMSNR